MSLRRRGKIVLRKLIAKAMRVHPKSVKLAHGMFRVVRPGLSDFQIRVPYLALLVRECGAEGSVDCLRRAERKTRTIGAIAGAAI